MDIKYRGPNGREAVFRITSTLDGHTGELWLFLHNDIYFTVRREDREKFYRGDLVKMGAGVAQRLDAPSVATG